MTRTFVPLLTAGLVLFQAATAQELPLTHYTAANEINPLPSGAMTAIYQDRSGYIWIAAWSGGLIRYDGRAMERYQDADGILNTGIWGLTQDASGYLWVMLREGARVTERPLQHYANGQRVHFIPADTLAPPLRSSTHNIAEDARGGTWMVTEEGGLIRFALRKEGGFGFTAIPDSNADLLSLAARRNGEIWVARRTDLLIFRGASVKPIVVKAEMPDVAIEVLYEGATGTLWAGCGDGSVWRYDAPGRRFQRVMQLGGIIRALAQDSTGILWVGGMGTGLARFDPGTGTKEVFVRANGLLDDYVWDLHQDREGNLWIGHMTGVSRLRNDYAGFIRFTARSFAGEQPRLPGHEAQVVIPGVPIGGDEQALFVGTNDGAGMITKDGRVEHLTSENGLPHNAVLSACLDEHRNIWVGTLWGFARVTFGQGEPLPALFSKHDLQLFGRKATIIGLASPGFANYSCSLTSIPRSVGANERDPLLCFGGNSFANCKLGTDWYTFATSSGLPDATTIFSIEADAAGYVYVGTGYLGMYRTKMPLNSASLRRLDSVDGTVSKRIVEPIFEPIPGSPRATIVSGVWNGKAYWAASDSGIVVFEGSPWRTAGIIRMGSGVAALTRTAGSIWAAVANVGLVEIDPVTRAVRRTITRDDGLLDDQVVSYRSITTDADGAVYFGTSFGLTRYLPAFDLKHTRAPQMGFGEVRFQESAVGRNELYVRYQGLSFANEKQVRYRTRLVGYDDDWSAPTATNDIRYTNLPAFLFPRAYTFEVLAANEDGVWATVPLQYRFRVQPAWWIRWWAVLFYLAIMGSGVFAIDRFQRRRVVRQERSAAAVRENELRAEAAEARAGLLQAENDRKTQELESARMLQLSMLPPELPHHPRVELDAYMRTATEVGGDYYDFHAGADGSLTFVLGDATGHGLAAGTLVATMKGLFTDHADEPDLTVVLQRAAATIRRMRLPKLYMALAIGRLKDDELELAGAGLPPALIYRAATDVVERVPLKGMPLGSPGAFPYRSTMLTLAPGDTVLLMSDGFPELRGADGDLLGYEEAISIFESAAGREFDNLLAHLKDQINDWCRGAPPDDDITFVLLRARAAKVERVVRESLVVG